MVSLHLLLIMYSSDVISGKVSATYCNNCLNSSISSSFSILQMRITISSPVVEVRTIILRNIPSCVRRLMNG